MNKTTIISIILTITLFSSCGKMDSGSTELNVMSFNIRYDNPEDGENNWKYRKDVAAQIVKDQHIDLLGTQEVLYNQLNDLKERLPEYQNIGVGREDGVHKGEYSAIFYKKDRFKELDHGTFWLSETPDTVSVGWDAALERIATWAKLKDKDSGKEFLFMNTHFDHVGEMARQNSVDLILTHAGKYSDGDPIILSGDFNSNPKSKVVQLIIDKDKKGHLRDSRAVADDVEGSEGTFHDFGEYPNLEKASRIDYIFVNNQVKVKKYESMPKKINDIFLSDHIPIKATLILE